MLFTTSVHSNTNTKAIYIVVRVVKSCCPVLSECMVENVSFISVGWLWLVYGSVDLSVCLMACLVVYLVRVDLHLQAIIQHKIHTIRYHKWSSCWLWLHLRPTLIPIYRFQIERERERE